MDFTKMMNKSLVEMKMNAKNKEEVINKMSQMLYDSGRIRSVDEFKKDVFKREDIETTNMDMGVAIPHSQSPAILKTSIALARLNDEISWEDYGKPVKIIFLLAVASNDKGVEHLEIISKIAELLIDEKFIETLKRTKNVNKLLKRMNKLIGGM